MARRNEGAAAQTRQFTPRDIAVPVAAALLASLITWAVTLVSKQITTADQQGIALELEKRDAFRAIMINDLKPVLKAEMKKDPDFKGPQGKSGNDGAVGPTGKDNWGPVGAVFAFAGPANSLPEEWRICDGSALSRTEFKELYDIIKNIYGNSGNDSFNLPNYQGYFLRGVDPNGAVDTEKRTVGSPQKDALQDHHHTGYWHLGKFDHSDKFTVSEYPRQPNEQDTEFKVSGAKGEAVRVSSETRPKNIAVHWIIRVKRDRTTSKS